MQHLELCTPYLVMTNENTKTGSFNSVYSKLNNEKKSEYSFQDSPTLKGNDSSLLCV